MKRKIFGAFRSLLERSKEVAIVRYACLCVRYGNIGYRYGLLSWRYATEYPISNYYVHTKINHTHTHFRIYIFSKDLFQFQSPLGSLIRLNVKKPQMKLKLST